MHRGTGADAALALARKQRQVLQRVLAGVELDGAPIPAPLYPGPLLHICTTVQLAIILRTDRLDKSLVLPVLVRLLKRDTRVQAGR